MFFKRIDKICHNTIVEACIILFVLLTFLPPIGFWLDVNRIESNNDTYKVGEKIHFFIDREVYVPTDVSKTIRINKRLYSDEPLEVCRFTNNILLKPGSVLKTEKDENTGDVLGTSLETLTSNICSEEFLLPGYYFVEICYEVNLNILPNRKKCVRSNTFQLISKEE